jgi:replicative DNA helicase
MAIHSLEAEQCVIGSILIKPHLLDMVSETLCTEDFFSIKHRRIFESLCEMSAERLSVDEITVAEHMQARDRECEMSYLIDLSGNTPSTENVTAYTRIVRECSRKRALGVAMSEALASVHEDTAAKADDLIAKTAAAIGALQCSDGQGVRTTKEILKSLSQKWDKRSQMNGEIDGLETGLKVLDERYSGWKPGDLIVIGGRPSMGKSALALQIAVHNAALRGKRVKVFSLEMTDEVCIERATANLAGIHLDVLRKCAKSDFAAYQSQIVAAAHKLASADLMIDETPGLHINQIMARSRNAHRKAPLDLVVVDHINIATGNGQSREREMASITGGLKALAKELGCPVVAVTQLNRDLEKRADKHPVMSDLRDSGSIEQDADIVLLVYRDEYYHPDSVDKGIVELITGKFREGETGYDAAASLLHMAKIADLDRRWQRPEQEAPVRGFKPYAAS